MMDMSKFNKSEIISAEDLNSQMTNKVQRITEVFPDMPATKARSLLMKNRWDVSRTLESAYDGLDDDDEAGSSTAPQTPPKTCEICFENEDDVIAVDEILPCRHKFCQDCLGQHISIFISDSSGLARNAVTCPGFRCSNEIDDEIVFGFLSGKPADLKSKYMRMIANAFVQSSSYIKWCPQSGCTNAVTVDEGAIQTNPSVRCNCRFWFCFSCQEQIHEPLSCELYKRWANVTSEEAQSQKWIMQNSKKCPNATCRVDIQKNGGCTHMTCGNCSYEFCWICMGKWKVEGGHACDVRTAKAVDESGKVLFESRMQHFNSHYQATLEAMKNSLKFFKEELKPHIPDEIELPTGLLKTDFIDNALEILNVCRRTLMYSYAFSYYMTTSDNEIFVFEQKLTNLEKCTANLAEKFQSIEIESETFENLKQKKVELTDAALVSFKCRQHILENIREGHEKDYWKKFPISLEQLQPAVANNEPNYRPDNSYIVDLVDEDEEQLDFVYDPMDFI